MTALTHEPTRALLASRSALPPRFEHAPRRVRLADTDDARVRPPSADLVLIGYLLSFWEHDDGRDVELGILVDDATGQVYGGHVYTRGQAHIGEAEPDRLATSLAAFFGGLAACDDLLTRTGRFSSLRDRSGPAAVEDARAALRREVRAVLGDASEPPLFWEIAALLRPPALIAGPGDGLRLDLPTDLFDTAPDDPAVPDGVQVLRYGPSDLPSELVHEPTRAFLERVGVPDYGVRFSADPVEPLPEHPGLVRFGSLVDDAFAVVHGTTGEIACLVDDVPHPLNTDISTMMFTEWLFMNEHALNTGDRFYDLFATAAGTLTAVVASLDPVACRAPSGPGDLRYWPEVFHDEAGGAL